MNKRTLTQRLTLTALLAALTAALTFFVKLPVPMTHGGFVHLGDSMIYLAACLLPAPNAALVAAIGGGLADWLSGAPAWIPATVVLKACMALTFSARPPKLLCARNAVALLPAGAINIVGYLLYEALVFGGWKQAIPSLPGNVTQSVGSAVVFVLLALALDRLRVKSVLQRRS